MKKITKVTITYPSPQGLMVVSEVLGAKVRNIQVSPDGGTVILSLFDATDGSEKPRYLNLHSAIWYEFEKDSIVSS